MFKRNERGFTLIELIAVLTIMAILASAIIPNLANEVTKAAASAEDQSLATIHRALDEYVVNTHVFPGIGAGQWDAAIAPFLSLPTSAIGVNRIGSARRIIVRPTSGLGAVPYDQAALFTAGTLPTAFPLQSRLLLISDLNGDTPTDVLANDQFDAVWQQTGVIPIGFTSTDKFRIERISFARFFHPVTVNCASVANTPQWSIDAAALQALNAGVITVYLITGTLLNMFINGTPAGTIVVNRPVGVNYDGATWSY
jgi:prepilin-type N-terminal cleavage/methylation domain-containing protein